MTEEELDNAKKIQSSIKFLNHFKNDSINKSKEDFKKLQEKFKNRKDGELPPEIELIYCELNSSRESASLLNSILNPYCYDCPNELKQEILEELNLFGPNGFVEQEFNNIFNIVDTKITYYQNKMKEL